MKSIIEAVTKTAAEIGKIAKANFNKFDKYDFASIDDFMGAVNGPMSANGLVVVVAENSCETIQGKSGKPWLQFEFAFTLYHKSGESLPGVTRTVAVPWTGAQSYGSAQSYALKQYLRAQFLLATGDEDDPDHEAKQDDPPETTTKPKAITYEQIEELETLGKSKPFDSYEHFAEFISIGMACLPSQLNSDQARKTIAFLKSKPDTADWPEKQKTAFDLARLNIAQRNKAAV